MGHRYAQRTKIITSYVFAIFILVGHHALLALSAVISLFIPVALAALVLLIFWFTGALNDRSVARYIVAPLGLATILVEVNVIRIYVQSIFMVRPPRVDGVTCLPTHEVRKIISRICEETWRAWREEEDRLRFDEIKLIPAPDVWTFGAGSRRVLVLGWPLIRQLSAEQLRALLTHELAHHHGASMARHRATWRVASSYERLSSGMDVSSLEKWSRFGAQGSMVATDGSLFQMLAFLLPTHVINIYRIILQALQQPDDRLAEFYSDREAAAVCGSRVTAQAVLAVAELNFNWRRFVNSKPGIAPRENVYGAFEKFQQNKPMTDAERRDFDKFIDEGRGHGCHPSIQQRIVKLGQSLEELRRDSHVRLPGEIIYADKDTLRIEKYLGDLALEDIERRSDEADRRSAVRAVAMELKLLQLGQRSREETWLAVVPIAYLLERHCGRRGWKSKFDKKISHIREQAAGGDGHRTLSALATLVLEGCLEELANLCNNGGLGERAGASDHRLSLVGKVSELKRGKMVVDRKKFEALICDALDKVGFVVPDFYFADTAS